MLSGGIRQRRSPPPCTQQDAQDLPPGDTRQRHRDGQHDRHRDQQGDHGEGERVGAAAVDPGPEHLYLGLIANGRVDVPVRTFPLPAAGDAWLASAGGGNRVVVLPG
jgi:hypothetical protein